MGDAPTVEVGDHTVRLGLPRSYAMRFEIRVAANDNALRAAAAALGACWLAGGSPNAPRLKYSYQPLKFGGDVLDDLVGRGVSELDIIRAGQVALAHLAQHDLTEDEVSGAEGNSEAGTGGSTS